MTGQHLLRSASPESLDCYIGLDLGTSGVRAVAIDPHRQRLAEAVTGLSTAFSRENTIGDQSAASWWQAVVKVLRQLTGELAGRSVQALAVDGTSSTLLLTDPGGNPLSEALMYNDSRSRASLPLIAAAAPQTSPVHSATSSLAKLLHLRQQIGDRPFLALHQADWILGKLGGRFGISDENNCLKLGYDSLRREWPDWLEAFDLPAACLPEVHPPGTAVGHVAASTARLTGLPIATRLVTGTTDSNAATLAAGAKRVGDAVTSLGSTLVLKILSDRPVNAPQYGVYSHRLGDQWLVGGASNSGGAVCAAYFTPEQMRRLTPQLDPGRTTGLDYYPLLRAGERFPLNDPDFPPRLTPRPADDVIFFQAMLEGIASIEREGYALLHQLGAPKPKRILSIGGGAVNEPWRRIRERLLGIPVVRASQTQAAYGTALLALAGCHRSRFSARPLPAEPPQRFPRV